jgi:predicted DNA-binding WGR domain protein
MQTERVELYFQQGSSDKVYHLQLESVEEQWSVNAQWGRRGSALQSDTKVRSVAYADAKRVYDRLLREKTGKGYLIAQATANGDTPISVGLPSVKEHSGHAPELLTPSRNRKRCSWYRMRLGGSNRNSMDDDWPYKRRMANIRESTNSASLFQSTLG